jgi:hypothetical protein
MFLRSFSIFGLILLCGLLVTPCITSAQQQIQFSWAVLTDTPDGRKTLDASLPISLGNGATLQIYIEQQPGAYIYLYLLDSTDDLSLLFPDQADYYSSASPTAKKITIPAEPERFELVPPPGQEKLYLLASSARLMDLESLTKQYLENPDNPERKGAVLQELKKLRRMHSKLTQTTETSVPVAGTVRTRGENDNTFEAIKVNAVDFYSKTLRINHE